MPAENIQVPHGDKRAVREEEALAHDERWLLTQRVVRSKGFQRAAQLRAILLYVSKFAIMGTGEHLREDDLAREVLGRRADFDPAYDNIVRVQVSHLRRKLMEYFAGEGKNETTVIHIPKGSYLPHFEMVPLEDEAIAAVDFRRDEELPAPLLHGADEGEATTLYSTSKPAGKIKSALVWATGALLIICGVLYLAIRKGAVQPAQATIPAIFLPMIGQGKEVAIVLPDTSLMVIQQILNTEIDPVDYIVSDFPRNQLDKVTDPALREALMFLGSKKTTSFSETTIGLDWVESLRVGGLHGVLRYSRDLHVRDLSDGNVVLIGSRRSNPWMSLFSSRTNFQFVESNGSHAYSFVNTKPLPGEETQYLPRHTMNTSINYVDVALVRNFGENGFALLINGSDAQANEAAARFLLHGRLPAAIEGQLTRKDFNGLEIFLRGAHLDGESNDKFEIVAYRTAHG